MDGKALFSRNVKPGIFGLSIAPKEIFLVYTTQFVFLTIRLVPGNVVMVAIDMCGKSPITGEWIYGITWKHVYFNISVLFIADTTSILKLVFPATNCFLLPLLLLLLLLFLFICLFIYFVFCLFIHLFCFFVCLFIYFFFLTLQPLFLFLLSLLSSLLLLLLLVIVAFCVCVWLLLLLIANLIRMFLTQIWLCVPYFTVNTVMSFNDVYFNFINYNLIFTYQRLVWW